jgi:anti-anti-sigma factor
VEYVEIKHEGRAVVLTPTRALLGHAETEALEGKIREEDRLGTPYLVVNLRRVDRMNEFGTSAILMGYKLFAKREARLVLCSPQRDVLDIFHTMKLLDVIRIYSTEERALADYRPTG